MDAQLSSLKKTARTAGLWYLCLIIIGIYGLRFVAGQIRVAGNMAATAQNIITHEFLFRTGVASNLAGNLIFLFLVLAFYKLLKQVNERQAKLMVILVILQIPISFVVELLNFTSLLILKGEAIPSINPAQKQDMAILLLNMHNYGLNVLEIFWGIWLIPLGQLVYKSGFIHRIIGVLLIVGGIAYMADSFTYLLFPAYDAVVSPFAILASLGEIAIMLWLLIVGVKIREAQ